MAAIQLDKNTFNNRVTKLTEALQSLDEFSSCQSLLFVVGSSDGALSYQKSIALQTWWIGYEFPEMITLVQKDKITFLTSAKKCIERANEGAILETLRTNPPPKFTLDIIMRTKDPAQNKDIYKKLIDQIPEGKVGVVSKENPSGKLVNEWKEALKAFDVQLDTVDISTGLSVVMGPKDKDEINNIRLASEVTSCTMKNYFLDYLVQLIDGGKRITHEKLSGILEQSHLDERKRAKINVPDDINWKNVEWCYPPIIQSGGKYDLRPSAQSNEENLHPGTVVCTFGSRYKSYCTNVGRTILINPEKSKEDNYTFLLELQNYLISLITAGAICSDIYNKTVKYVAERKPELQSRLIKNFGFGLGIEFRDSVFLIGPKNDRPLVEGLVLNITLGFQDLENTSSDPKNTKYALFLADTVQVTPGRAIILTNEAEKELTAISYTFGDEEDDETKVLDVLPKRGAILESQLRNTEERAEGHELKRKQHQQQLHEQKHEENLAKFSGGAGGAAAKAKVTFKKFEAYRKDAPLPKNVTDWRIVVDRKAESVILPIYGQAVPFHLSTLKNVSKSDEGENILIRFNFITPGQATGKKEEHAFEDVNSTFVRSLSYRSSDIGRFSEIVREITELKKEVNKREAERLERAGIVEQDALDVVKGRRPHRLADVFVRPSMESKRNSGELEIHHNGLRFHSANRADSRIDILFSNIKHFFFQPCDGELIILLHIHLIHPVMIGKKKTKDVQFYREVTDASFDETGNRRRRANYGDEDELAQEQEERRLRQMLNREFQQFSEKISEASNKMVEVDVPFRDLAFQGVPHRQLVNLQPTTDCLVHLSDTPFLVITLADVETVHLERVQFGLKNFDMIFVFKDFTKPVVHINTIPSKQLENIKEWLDSVDIAFSEGPVNLSWPHIMKTINDDTKAFFETGGWQFLQPEGSDASHSESGSAFSAGSEFSHSESESESSEVGSSEFSESGSGSEAGSDGEDESGEDWDELEKKAEAEDRKKRDREEMDTEPRNSKQRRR